MLVYNTKIEHPVNNNFTIGIIFKSFGESLGFKTLLIDFVSLNTEDNKTEGLILESEMSLTDAQALTIGDSFDETIFSSIINSNIPENILKQSIYSIINNQTNEEVINNSI